MLAFGFWYLVFAALPPRENFQQTISKSWRRGHSDAS
jgi:hypothetical protein